MRPLDQTESFEQKLLERWRADETRKFWKKWKKMLKDRLKDRMIERDDGYEWDC